VAVATSALTVTTALDAIGDAYVKSGSPNTNTGSEPILRLQATGKNRALVFFEPVAVAQAVGAGTLVSARIELTIDNDPSGWGATGRPIAVHRLKQASAEYTATWACAHDANLYNASADCSGATAWDMSSNDPAAQPWLSPESATANIQNDQTGVVVLDVTADVAAVLATAFPGCGWIAAATARLW
jgi:hypothetical protein